MLEFAPLKNLILCHAGDQGHMICIHSRQRDPEGLVPLKSLAVFTV